MAGKKSKKAEKQSKKAEAKAAEKAKLAAKKADKVAKKAGEAAKQEAKAKSVAAKKAAEKAQKASKVGSADKTDSAKKSGKTKKTDAEPTAAGAQAQTGIQTPEQAQAVPEEAAPDQVEVLKLALRDTESKLVEAEQRLRQVQQELENERQALAIASAEPGEDLVVELAVQETLAEAVAVAAETFDPSEPADEAVVAESIAAVLDSIVEEIDLADDDPDHSGEAADAAAVFQEAPLDSEELTPPVPTADDDALPSMTWTLVRLRAEARRRDLSGYSTLSKGDLLARLSA